MTITQEQRMRIIMLYCNATIIHRGHERRIKEIFIDHHWEKHHWFRLLVGDKWGTTENGKLEECQLLLHSLDQLKEEHKRELAKLMNWEEAEIDQGRLWLSDKPDKDYPISTFHMLDELPYPAADFLRKHNYALPYEGIDLFEAGVAVRG
jgi:hypothetical protein